MSTGLSIRREEVTADLTKRVLYFQYLYGQDIPRAVQFLKTILDSISLSSQIHLYEEVASELFGLRPEVAQELTEEIVERHQDTEWWKLYETAHVARMNELAFEHCQTANERLVGHFINSGLTYHHPLLNMTLDQAEEAARELLATNDPTNPLQLGLVNRFLSP